MCPPGGMLGGHSKPAGSTGLDRLSAMAPLMLPDQQTEGSQGCRMGPCSHLLPEQSQHSIRSRLLCPQGGPSWWMLLPLEPLYLLSCLRHAPPTPPPGESSSARQQKMGLSVPCASLGSEKEQQVARMPSSSEEPTCVYSLQDRRKRSTVGGVGGETPYQEGWELGAGARARQMQLSCWTIEDFLVS